MSTYENCYSLVASLRRAVGEYSAAKVRGEDTLGGFDNDYLVEKINAAIRELYAIIARRVPGLFIKETTLTGVNSVYTLPWDYGKLISFKDPYGLTISEIGEASRRLTYRTGTKRLYRRVGNTLVLDQASVTDACKLVYKSKPRKIHHGLVVAGSALSMTLDPRAPTIADYFNGMIVENETAKTIDTISDYTAARVATLAAETPTKNDAYGIVPELPEWCHHLIAPKAIIMVRLEHPLAKRKPTQGDLSEYREMLRTTLVEYASPNEDTDYEELFTAYEPKAGGISI